MADEIIARRDEYDAKKQRANKIKKVTAAVLAAVFMVNVFIVAPVVGRLMKKTPDDTASTDPGVSEPVTSEIADAQTDTVTEEDTGKTPGEKVLVKSYSGNFRYYSDKNADIKIDVPYPDEIKSILKELNGKEPEEPRYTLCGYENKGEEVLTYTLKYVNNAFVAGESDYFGEDVKIRLQPSENVELLSPQMFVLDLKDGVSGQFDISFRYKNGAKGGYINIYYAEKGLGGYYSDIFSCPDDKLFKIVNSQCCFARIRGYDFFLLQYNGLKKVYSLAADYFGDVDENGEPLYKTDPYMSEYYDCPDCVSERYFRETREIIYPDSTYSSYAAE